MEEPKGRGLESYLGGTQTEVPKGDLDAVRIEEPQGRMVNGILYRKENLWIPDAPRVKVESEEVDAGSQGKSDMSRML